MCVHLASAVSSIGFMHCALTHWHTHTEASVTYHPLHYLAQPCLHLPIVVQAVGMQLLVMYDSCKLSCCVQVLFSAADILAAWQIWRIGQLQSASQPRCFWSIVAWLYNPFTVTISTRGSCDSLVTVMLLGVLLMLMQGRVVVPAVVYGLAVHFRIYPIIYAPGIVLYLAYRQQVSLSYNTC